MNDVTTIIERRCGHKLGVQYPADMRTFARDDLMRALKSTLCCSCRNRELHELNTIEREQERVRCIADGLSPAEAEVAAADFVAQQTTLRNLHAVMHPSNVRFVHAPTRTRTS